jgi:hypothetical protein
MPSRDGLRLTMSSRDEDWASLRFIGEEIRVEFEQLKLPLKKPEAPDLFHWEGVDWRVRRVISSWSEYGRKGRMARNMSPAHARTASRRGSWGVGRFYFRVEVQDGRVFDLYFDRAPDDASDRLGHWFLWREMAPSE